MIGLRAAVAMVAFAVYSACVDPDRVLRALRPLAGRSALTASLISRLVPVAAADAARLRDAAGLRGPAAAPVGRAPLARRLLAGSLDRAVDVAATLELRGYSLAAALARRAPVAGASRATTGASRRAAPRSGGRVAGKALGADAFAAYPAIEVGPRPADALAVSVAILAAGFAPCAALPARISSGLVAP